MNAQQNAFNPLRRTILTIALLCVGLVLSTETAAQSQRLSAQICSFAT